MKDPQKALRILFVEQAVGFGGSLIVVSHLLKCLKRRDFSPVVVGEMDEDVLRYHIGDRAKLEIIRHLLNYAHRAQFSRILKRFRSHFLYRFGMYAFTLAAAFANLVYTVRLCIVILRNRIDIVHINQPDNTEALIAALLLKRKIVIHAHGTGYIGLTHRWILPAVKHFVAISEHVNKYLLSCDIPESRISIVPNPTIVDIPSQQAIEKVRNAYEITHSQKTFGIFGRLVPWKGHKQFLAAAEIVLSANKDARAFIVGDISDGPDGFVSELRTLAQQSSFLDRITFTGHILKIEGMYGVMDVVVHASIEPEPFGLVITEAMAHGIPVVASNLGATQEIITHGYDGFIVDPSHADEMADAILRLLQDDQLRKTMGDRARENVEQRYNGHVYARRMGDMYHNVLRSA